MTQPDSQTKDLLKTAVEALEAQLRFLKEDLQRNETERVVFALQSMRFLASRVEEAITNERVDEATRIAHGPVLRRSRADGDAIRAAIFNILQDARRPLAVKEIMRELENRGVGVPGQGRPANVLAYLSRMQAEIKRVDYGMYAMRGSRSREAAKARNK